MAELTIEHNAGFFSCCSVRLSNIISFFNDKKRLPHTIDCSQQFYCYKDNHLEDINNTFFSEREEDNIVFETSIAHVCRPTRTDLRWRSRSRADAGSLSFFQNIPNSKSHFVCFQNL